MSRLFETYTKKIVPAISKELNVSNVHNVPKIEKIVVNVGAGEAVQNSKVIDAIVGDLKLITGQKPVVTRAKKSIASFKLREGMPIGVMVTLRNKRMYEFLDRVISIALPRVKDFKGVSPSSFDGKGNYNFAVREQLVFPEIEFDRIDKIRGVGITIVTNSKSDAECKLLLKHFGFFFRD